MKKLDEQILGNQCQYASLQELQGQTSQYQALESGQIGGVLLGTNGKPFKSILLNGISSNAQVLVRQALRAPGEGQAVEHQELLKTLEEDYHSSVSGLNRIGLTNDAMPTWETIKSTLTKEILEKALKIRTVFKGTSRLVLVPYYCGVSQMIEAIDANKVKGLQKLDTYQFRPKNPNLWNNGEPFDTDNGPQWGWMIVDAITNPIPGFDLSGTIDSYERIKALFNTIEAQGLSVLKTAESYLALMILSLGENNPIDKTTWTVLNAENLEKGGHLAGGDWGDRRIRLICGSSAHSNDNLRLRTMVEVGTC